MPKSKSDLEREAARYEIERREEHIRNAVKLRGAGPDDPIPWDAYGTFPRETKKKDSMETLRNIARAVLSPFSGASAKASSDKNKRY